MHRIGTISFALIVALAGATQAQNQTNQSGEQQPQHQDGHSGGTAPGGAGSSGWTGGTGTARISSEQHTTGAGGAPKLPDPTPSTDLQPPVATGHDLKGPPMAFPSNKAPE